MELPIGKVLYKLRKEKGVTQENLANAVGVSVAAVMSTTLRDIYYLMELNYLKEYIQSHMLWLI